MDAGSATVATAHAGTPAIAAISLMLRASALRATKSMAVPSAKCRPAITWSAATNTRRPASFTSAMSSPGGTNTSAPPHAASSALCLQISAMSSDSRMMTACSAENGKKRLGSSFGCSLMSDHHFTGSEAEPRTFVRIVYKATNGGEQL